MEKVKVLIDKRLDKIAPDMPRDPDVVDLEDLIAQSDWDKDDPGVGRALLLPDGREVFNPVPMAAPVDIDPEQDMFRVMEQRILKRLYEQAGVGVDDALETEDEANDFNVADEMEVVSGYEVEMQDEFPNFPAPPAPPSPEPPSGEDPERSKAPQGASEGGGAPAEPKPPAKGKKPSAPVSDDSEA